MLVVIAIISLLAAILFPVFARAREKGRQTACASNLKQLGLAWLMYAQDYDETACPSYFNGGNTAWDFQRIGGVYLPGLLGAYTHDGRVAGCPDWVNRSATVRPYNGYAYNATYLGGDMGTPLGSFPPAPLARISAPANTAAFADGGYANLATGAAMPENFLRAPSDTVYYGAGLIDFRHTSMAEVAYADGHVHAVPQRFPFHLQFPQFGGLSQDDSAYGPGMQPASAYPQP